ncbi:Arginyl-tRNA--protein transferase 1 [Cryomyces antarcticus]|nr:Arginyl-tRNA--protein transferase 1 [Cryomyces antarcticus]
MRYKGDYKPQFILDLETLQWNAMDDEMRALLDTQKYVSISRERRLATEQNEATEADKSEPDKHSGATVDQQYLFDDPAEAADSGLSLFDLTMPGMMTANEVMEHIDLDHISLEIRGAVHRMEQLVSWQEGSLTDSRSLKGIVAELAACVGPDVSREITIKFG